MVDRDEEVQTAVLVDLELSGLYMQEELVMLLHYFLQPRLTSAKFARLFKAVQGCSKLSLLPVLCRVQSNSNACDK